MKKALLALVFGSALFLAACGGGEKATDVTTNNNNGAVTENKGATENTDAVAKGETVVQKACISCHGANLEGIGNFPALNNVGSRLSQDEILTVINNGRGGMPAGVVKGEDAKAAAAYLATLK